MITPIAFVPRGELPTPRADEMPRWPNQGTGVSPRLWRSLRRIALTLGAALSLAPAFGAAATWKAPALPGVSIEQRLGEQLPLATVLRNAHGDTVRLGDYFGRKPVVLIFGYSRCPRLCSVVADAAVQTLRDLEMTVGKDYVVVYISIDPTDGPRELSSMKRRDMAAYGRSQIGWYYLGGTAANVRHIANAAGFHYVYDDRLKLYDHPSGIIIVTPQGKLSRYFFGVDYPAQDVAGAIKRAAAGEIGQSVYALLLICCRGLGITGRYGRIIWVCMEIAVTLTLIAVFGGIGYLFWQERRARRPAAAKLGVGQ